MKRPGRNELCPCSSGKKVKWCCGERVGPPPEDLARAELHALARPAARRLGRLDDERIHELVDQLVDLPDLDFSLLWALPRLFSSELERLRRALADEVPGDDRGDRDEVLAVLPAVLGALDTQVGRLRLARATLALADADRIDADLAAAAVIDLASPSDDLVRASIVQALLVDTGATATPSGLVVVAR